MRRLSVIDGSRSEHVQRGLSHLCATLESVGMTTDWHADVTDASPGSTVLVHDPVDDDRIPEGCRVFGQRTLDRRQRLLVAEQCGLPVPRWRSLERVDQVVELLDEWGVDQLLYKADRSYQRKGVLLARRGRIVPRAIARPDADVFMVILDGDPHTLKIDVFLDQIIACRKTFTRSVFDRKFRSGFTAYSSLEPIPPIEPQLKALGRALLDYGAGLTSVDVMIDRAGRPWVIELNTCSVGREATWRRWPDLYLEGYIEGLARWVRDGCPGRSGTDAAALAARVSRRSGGEDVTCAP